MNPLDILLNAIKQGLSEIQGIQFCDLTPDRRDNIRLPAILLDLAELEPSTDPGTDQLALISHWEVRVLVSDNFSYTQLWALVQTVMLWLFNHTWPEKNIGRVRFKQAVPDHFSPDYQGHKIWLIEWSQLIRVGDNVWDGSGVIPTEFFVAGLSEEAKTIQV